MEEAIDFVRVWPDAHKRSARHVLVKRRRAFDAIYSTAGACTVDDFIVFEMIKWNIRLYKKKKRVPYNKKPNEAWWTAVPSFYIIPSFRHWLDERG